ncbi:tyrosine-type recombinase/integrase [Leptospira terpstrae]|uniref:Site-specific recombinase, phage integrase family n=1 Tax=Leptospira terpstrae serovar Hualin str. LT 11-33 = ATCC 700639 TaxID=1257025 RepID=N1W346_9LEPT|nr:site-specific integrase [Leptospira terpstrae]EMY62106.1 site-specific recombinase, phage integrase family [Leptospira terpstrae serovar Hualin str. LT 11-33 = ATCC 700639]
MIRSIEPHIISDSLPLLTTRDQYRVTKFLTWNKGETVTPRRFLNFLQERKNLGIKSATLRDDKNSVFRAMKKATVGTELGFAIDGFRKQLNEVFPIKVPRTRVSESDLITLTEIQRINKFGTARQKSISLFLWTTGVRAGDLVSIKLKDCRPLDNNLIEIKLLGKGEKKRNIVIPISLFHQIRQTFCGYVFLFETVNKDQYKPHAIWKIVSAIGKKYLGRDIYPHLFRHTFITDMIREGNDIGAVAEFAGNTAEVIARTYLHSSLDRSAITRRLDKICA